MAVLVVLAGPLFGFARAGVAADVPDRVPGPVPARLVAVIDGDTIEVEARIWIGQAVVTRVRLLGIDAPERDGKCARERDLIGGGGVTLTDIQYGKYAGRVLARVRTAGGADISEVLLARGLVRAYGGGRRAGWCAS